MQESLATTLSIVDTKRGVIIRSFRPPRYIEKERRILKKRDGKLLAEQRSFADEVGSADQCDKYLVTTTSASELPLILHLHDSYETNREMNNLYTFYFCKQKNLNVTVSCLPVF